MSSLPSPKTLRPSRDFVTTIQADGSRFVLHPTDTRGFWTLAQRWSAWGLVAIYLALPWVPVGGYPAVFLDVGGRRFHLFGATLAFQDVWLLFFAITGLGFSLFLVTALIGRVWCGWACPQTVFLEHVFRRVERWMEGDAVSRRRLDAAPWTTTKMIRRGAKQVIFFLLSALIMHLFLAYFVSVPQLWSMMRTAPSEHWSAFVFVAVASGVLYFNFAWFREQLCIVICPYGRMQSVLLDDHSLVIGYDAKRGEPRGKVGTPDAGACIDCARCVQVCPTGIDIRQGLQIECTACTACVDACDEVMDKINRPRGLIRYDSTVAFSGGRTRWLRPRVWLYLGLLLVGATVAMFAVSSVRPAMLGVTRMQGRPYHLDAGSVRNQFLIRLVNKNDQPATFTVRAVSPASSRFTVSGFDGPLTLAPLGEEVRPLVVQVARADYLGKFPLRIVAVAEGGAFELVREAEFTGPDAALLREDSQ